MGSKQDIRIYRNGPRQLVVDSDAVANGDLQVLGKMTSNDLNVLGNFMINGKDLQAVRRVVRWKFTQSQDNSSLCDERCLT